MKITVEVRIPDKDISFDEARALAESVASVYSDDPMLLAWYDRQNDRFFPQVTCCDCGDGRPTWEIYADSRGASVKVVDNDGDYVFLFI
ncbi:MAG: hypothetical protein DRG83_16215 [Deltaproteobacteria bacterium]|nr:MAG: hypothetical protein DRG83_16215 [Deltaproteobacteria bacterium]